MRRNWRTRWWIIAMLAVLVSAVGVANWWNKKLVSFQQQALILDNAMHWQMASGDLAGIYDGADEQFRSTITREKSDALFKTIARKLGAPLDCVQGDTKFSFGISSTVVTSVCETHFTNKVSGFETFTWIRTGDKYSLLSYNLNSDAFLEQ